MKIKFMALASVALLAFGLSLSVSAGSIDDTDGDLIPDVFDNCSLAANGPGDLNGNNQIDIDGDGLGNACDCDFVAPAPGDGFVLGNDIVELFAVFGGTSPLHDQDFDGFILGTDIVICFAQFGGSPGPGSTAI
jgi:hypothetical protein